MIRKKIITGLACMVCFNPFPESYLRHLEKESTCQSIRAPSLRGSSDQNKNNIFLGVVGLAVSRPKYFIVTPSKFIFNHIKNIFVKEGSSDESADNLIDLDESLSGEVGWREIDLERLASMTQSSSLAGPSNLNIAAARESLNSDEQKRIVNYIISNKQKFLDLLMNFTGDELNQKLLAQIEKSLEFITPRTEDGRTPTGFTYVHPHRRRALANSSPFTVEESTSPQSTLQGVDISH